LFKEKKELKNHRNGEREEETIGVMETMGSMEWGDKNPSSYGLTGGSNYKVVKSL